MQHTLKTETKSKKTGDNVIIHHLIAWHTGSEGSFENDLPCCTQAETYAIHYSPAELWRWQN